MTNQMKDPEIIHRNINNLQVLSLKQFFRLNGFDNAKKILSVKSTAVESCSKESAGAPSVTP